MATNYIKDADAVLDYIFDWSLWLLQGEEITASDMTLTPGISLDSHVFGVATATAWLSGGSEGRVYSISNRISTNQGRTDERSITIRVTNR